MATFNGGDGTRLAYHQVGAGRPLICVPGGPMQASAYLGDLGGLSAHRSLVLLDLRGTGASAVPADPASYRCDRQVDDVEALRVHLGLDRIELLAHSAGAALALLYAARHLDRVGRLALLNPSPRVVGLEVTDLDRRQVAELRRGEVWFPDAFAALERIWSGEATAADWTAIAPFTYGRWDAVSQAHLAREASQTNADAAAGYYSAGALDPEATSCTIGRADPDRPGCRPCRGGAGSLAGCDCSCGATVAARVVAAAGGQKAGGGTQEVLGGRRVTTSAWLMLRRNLLYTAVTRAKQMVVLVGSRRALAKAVRTPGAGRRYTNLTYRLQPGSVEATAAAS